MREWDFPPAITELSVAGDTVSWWQDAHSGGSLVSVGSAGVPRLDLRALPVVRRPTIVWAPDGASFVYPRLGVGIRPTRLRRTVSRSRCTGWSPSSTPTGWWCRGRRRIRW